MPVQIQLNVPPEKGHDQAYLVSQASVKLGIAANRIQFVLVTKRSIDARGRNIKLVITALVYADETYTPPLAPEPTFRSVTGGEEVHIIGAGPAGYFAALQLISMGKKPIIIERGKDVRARRRDLTSITRQHLVNPESNYCFGEGGAGTYSDGKLYTRSDKRGDVQQVLDYFIHFGASADIGVDARPHIGTNKLPDIITRMRECIISFGGEIHFNTRMDDLEVQGNTIKSITINDNEKIFVNHLILATGHSSRMIFEMLHRHQIMVEAKPFALGVRAEHPQALIDQAQYHCDARPDYLPPAYYSLVNQELERGVYSFCMCPGGIIAPCATSPGEIVTNGWSPSKRNNPFANSGIVVEIRLEDLAEMGIKPGPFMALELQQMVEHTAWIAGGQTQTAPAQRMVDFSTAKTSTSLPACSYTPGVASVNLNEVFPAFIHKRLAAGFKSFGRKMKNYYTNEAILVAPETRTSSPVRIPRDREKLHHIQVNNLFPCGEGAGYAGGIVSAAIDGMKCALATNVK